MAKITSENQQQTQPTYDIGSRNRTRATLVGGERDHHCAIPVTTTHRNNLSEPLFKTATTHRSFVYRTVRYTFKLLIFRVDQIGKPHNSYTYENR